MPRAITLILILVVLGLIVWRLTRRKP